MFVSTSDIPEVGSSRRRTAGSRAITMQISRMRWSPWESDPPSWSPCRARSNIRSRSSDFPGRSSERNLKMFHSNERL
ncbi:MAG TPA: hypothetical protein DD658_01225 [Deltaproteobacteria bacterium]|nr:hypothetical protein [Deltaproteobacteria bacterium]